MLKKSCIIAYTTPNYYISEYFIESIEHVVDKKDIYLKLEELPESYKTQKDGFQTKIWYYCLKRKIEHLRDTLMILLNKYEYYICSDCDIHFFKNEGSWNELFTCIKSSSKQIYFLREGNTNDVNAGFYVIKNEYVLDFVRYLENYILNKNLSEYNIGDQNIINRTKHILSYEYIPTKYTIWGRQFNIHNKNNYILHHAVCTKNSKEKEEQIKYILRLMN